MKYRSSGDSSKASLPLNSAKPRLPMKKEDTLFGILGEGKNKPVKKATSNKIYLTSPEAMFFTLNYSQFNDGAPLMAFINYADEPSSMDEDAGYTENDYRQKMKLPAYSRVETNDTPWFLPKGFPP